MIMAKVTYKAPEGEPRTQTQFGIKWTDGKPVEVTNPATLARVRRHDHYDVEDAQPVAAVPEAPKAVHKGFGKFSIEQGDKVLVEGLGKPDADAFNALSDEDKAVYVEAALNPAS